MLEFFTNLFATSFMPHGHCYLWDPWILWMNVGADIAIAAAYYSIPVALVLVVRRRRDLVVPQLFLLFGAFILLCGTTHIIDIITVWTPAYRVEGLVKAVTGAVSVATALVTWAALPKVLSLPGLDALREANAQLEAVNEELAQRGTELERSNAALHASEERLARIIRAVPVGLLTVTEEGNVAEANQAALEMFGFGPGELNGRPVHELIADNAAPEHGRQVAAYMADPQPRGMSAAREVQARRRDGTGFPVEVALVPLEGLDTVEILASVRDLSERDEAQAELRRRAGQLERLNVELKLRNAELDRFAYVASHDLRSPLRAIDNLASWVAEDSADRLEPESRENLSLLRARVARLDQLLDDLLTYSRAVRSEEQASEVDTGELLDGVITLLGPPEGFEIIVQRPMPTLRTARTPLQQVLMNLVSNALKHHDGPPGRVEVSWARGDGDVEFTVKDDGPGVAPEFHEVVFEMFKTLKPRDEVEGSGIGLSVVKRVVEHRGGVVRLESDGRGAAFHFTWPEAREEA